MATELIGTSYEIGLLGKVLIVYISLFVVELINKAGHFPSGIRFEKIFPIPKAIAFGATNRYGGMIAYALIFIAVWWVKPEIVILQFIGFTAWIMFMFHSILGSINFEIPIPKRFIGRIVTEEIPNELWYVFVPLAILAFIYFCCYYLDIANLFFGTNIPIING